MSRRHPVDAAILTGLVIGHIAVAATAARIIHALTRWGRRNDR